VITLETPYGPGTIGVSANELARYTAFAASWSGLRVPAGTQELWCCGYDTSSNSNDVIRRMRPEDQWVFIMDDDHTFGQDLLLQLLARNVDIVVPLYTQRKPPFHPCVYKRRNAEGLFEQCDWKDLTGASGLLEVASSGKAGVLIKRPVIEALTDPWFAWDGRIGEDHVFFTKARAAGFRVHVDLDHVLGHCTPVEVAPHREPDGRWCAEVNLTNGLTVQCWAERLEPRDAAHVSAA
jgi:hypothetical protein